MTSDDDRIAYLAGDGGESLSPAERAELARLRAALGEPAMWAEPAAGLEEAIVAAVVAEARGSTSIPAARTPAWRRLRLPRAGPGLVALGAAALVALVIVLGTRSSSPAPQQFAMVVTGTYLAPAAHGSATATKMESGWQIKLSTSGLPHLSGGRYYEAWLKDAAGILVPVGTFNDATQVTLWSGVPVTQFRSLSVTEQRATGNPASSGLRVLIGAIRQSR
jgi:hypothetical protein